MMWHIFALTAETKKYHLESADEETPRKGLTSLLKLALDLMDRICSKREFHNQTIDGRNDLAWHRLRTGATRFDLGTSTAPLQNCSRQSQLVTCSCKHITKLYVLIYARNDQKLGNTSDMCRCELTLSITSFIFRFRLGL